MPIQVIPQEFLPLSDNEVLEGFREIASNLVFFDDMVEAYKSYRYLQWLLSQNPGLALENLAAAAEYNQMLILLKTVALPILSEAEIEDLFRNNITPGLFNPYIDLWEKVVAKLVRFFIFEDRDPFKAKLRLALEANEEVLTETTIKAGSKTLPGTVGNWLQDYRREAGGGKVSTLARTAYITNSFNTKGLSGADREKVRKLIELYEKLKISSMDAEGIEENYLIEDQGKLWVWRNGRFEEAIDEKTKKFAEELKKKGIFAYGGLPVHEAYARFKEEKKAVQSLAKTMYQAALEPGVARELERLKSEKTPNQKLFSLCYDAVLPGPGKRINRELALALILLLAERGEIDALLSHYQKFNALFADWLQKRGRTADIEGFLLQPKATRHLAQFLRVLLEEKLGIETDKAAQIAARIGNLMKTAGKPQYLDMAYFDASERKFIWK